MNDVIPGKRHMSAVETIQAMYDAARAGDFDGFFAHLGDDIVLEEPDFLPYGGTYQGIARSRWSGARSPRAHDR
jgi:ketosteroid isomerase-like protein